MANAAILKASKPLILTPAVADALTLPPVCAFAMLTHPGRIRRVNQDACAALPEHGVFVICDGVGGAAAGEVASHLAAETFLHTLSEPIPQPHRRTPSKSSSSAVSLHNGTESYPANHPHTRLNEAVRSANQAVFRHSRKSQSLRGMGTTLVAALWDDDTAPTLWVAHVGDSRCYRFRRGALHLLTQDHSLVEEQFRAGLLSRAQAGASPIRNIITRAIGTQPTVEADIAAHDAQPGDLYLLASDGLTRELTDPEIATILARIPARATSASLDPACQSLIDAANAHGGHDNITALLIACP